MGKKRRAAQRRHALRGIVRAAVPDLLERLEPRQLLTAVTATSPTNGQQQVGLTANITVTFDSPMNASTLTASTLQLRDASGRTVAAAISYNATNRTATINPNASLVASNDYYTVSVAGGSTGVADTSGNRLAKTYSFGFTTGKGQFSEQTVFSGLISPTNIEFAADGRVFVAEKRGVIKVFDSLTDTTPDTFADLRTEVHNYWDRGLLGLALDPKFTTGRPYVYALYSYDADIGGAAPKWGTPNTDSDPGGPSPTGTGVTASCRLVKLTASGNRMTSEQVLINDWPDQFPSHSIGDLRFGPDGYLYASGGDGASFNFADYGQFGNPFNDPTNEGGALRTQDILSSGDPTQLDGTIIRINPDTGVGAPGNPLTGDANRARIVAAGLRNPFRITFRPGTSELWVDDTGWDTWEEINRAVSVNDSSVDNFGWPAYEGPGVQSGYQSLNLPLLKPLYDNPSLVTSPYFTYRHADHVDPAGRDATGASSSTGLAFYSGGSYPSAFNGALFFSDYSRKAIYVMYADPNGLPDPATRTLFPTTTSGAVQLKTGPNGDLFYVDMNGGTVVRMRANATQAPQAVITADKTSGPLPLTVAFSGAQSTGGSTLSYAWDLDNNGTFTDSATVNPTYTFTTAGPKTVTLRVTDATGASSTATLRILAGNVAPVPTITTPTSALHWKVGDTITFAGGAADAEDGTLPASSLSWNAVLVYSSEADPTAHQDRPLQQFNGVAGGSFSAPEWNYPVWLEIRLTATDSGGLSTTTTLRLDPAISKINLSSNVPGVPLTLNGNAYTTSVSKTVLVGSNNTISAPASFVSNGVTYNFANWSDGGAISHQITAAATDANLVATYGTGLPAPTSFTATPVADKTQVTLTWSYSATSAATFVIERSTSPTFATIDVTRTSVAGSTFYVDWGLTRNVQYYYRMRAVSGSLVSSNSSAVPVKLAPAATGIPAAPTNFKVVANPGGSNTEAQLTWTDNATNETQYEFQRSTSSTFATIDVARTGNADSELYVDWGLKTGTQYYYRLRASNASGASAWQTVAYKSPSAGTVPAAPTGLKVMTVAGNSGELSLSWTDATGLADYYVIERSTSATFATYTTLEDVSYYTGPYIDWGLSPNTTYYYRVKGVNAAGSSGYSAIVGGKTST